LNTVAISDVEALRQTDKAVLCAVGGAELWVPRSQISRASEVREAGDCGTLVVSQWWYEAAKANRIVDVVLPSELPESSKVYKQLVREFHPDRNADGAEVMRAVNQLWQSVVSEVKSRKALRK
jgi:hypothetical protein